MIITTWDYNPYHSSFTKWISHPYMHQKLLFKTSQIHSLKPLVVLNAERVILSRVQVLELRPIPMPAKVGYSLRRGRGGSLDCMWGVQTHSGPLVSLVPFRKNQGSMNGTPHPNWKWLPALGIKPGSLDHESQPLTIGPFLTLDTSFQLKTRGNTIFYMHL